MNLKEKFDAYQERILDQLPKGIGVWTDQYREDLSYVMAGIAVARLVQWGDYELADVIDDDFDIYEDGYVYSRNNLVDVALDESR